MTNSYDYSKIRVARNEFEALMKIHGVSNRRMAKIMGITEITSRKYIVEPSLIRVIHAFRMAQYLGLTTLDIVDTIAYDLKQ